MTVGIPPMVNLFFPPLIKRFKERYPQIKLMAQEAGGQVIEQRVLAGELEVGVTVLPAFAFEELAAAIRAGYKGRTVLVVGHTHTLQGILQAVANVAVDKLTEEQFDRLYKVVIPAEGEPTLTITRYGEPTP